MKVSVKSSEKCQKILEIEVSKQTIKEEFDRYYNEIKKTAQVPGFRKGKAPREMLERYFADKANDKVLTNLVTDTYHKAIEKENIHPVALPQISNMDFKKDEKLTFEAKVDMRPEFNLKEYKNIKVKKQPLQINDDEVNKVITYLQERYAQFIPVDSRQVKTGDYIICDYSYSVDSKIIQKKDNVWLFIDKEMFIPGLNKELEGIKAGENKEFILQLPKDFYPAEIAGHDAKFNVSVNEIKEKKLPELNDEFAKMVGKNTVDEIKNHIREDLTKEKEERIKQDMRTQVIDSLIKAMPIEVPPGLVEKREQSLKDSAQKRLKQQGLTQEQIQEEQKKMGELISKEAIKQIRAFFILESIAKKENIKVEESELESRLELIAQSYNQKKEDVFSYFQKNNLLENLHWEVLEEKILIFILDNADIEEKA